ncbi:beta-ketoacyl synthase N-terminal-like domain-containing protein [Streptomyces sp. NPDC020379]|uniref:beta-ketoacyl synthase N-terminal-like domain-containing protein n=1 Tax=Streptomyces sp. NPDC020379 TaxID=3365071 RepID=UPI00379B9186
MSLSSNTVPVAIVGMSGRFPGASGVAALWDVLVEGRDAVTEAPADRPWFHELYATEQPRPGSVLSTRGGFLSGVDGFDFEFFGMSLKEARRTDPQVRLLLEVAYEAAQDAGSPMQRLAPRQCSTGVFVGVSNSDYLSRQLSDLTGYDLYMELGSARCAFSGRVAYAFDLCGPAVTVDTACSSSLTAVHLACQSLRSGECQVALAGGSNLLLLPHGSVAYGQAGALSPDGRCKFGDASADGYVRSEAVGMVVLKPLARALADGDRVRAVILGSAVNNDGFTGSGMVSPSVQGQVRLLTAAYANAGVDPREVAFVEAHGTGTSAGDRTELTALSQVLGPRPSRRALVGSAKTSLGHAEAAAGVVGLIKAVLSLENGLMPGNAQITDLTPAIDWDDAAVRLNIGAEELHDTGKPVVAGVNSFGATGSNAHVVIGQAPPRPASPPGRAEDRLPVILPASARSVGALRALARQHAELLGSAGGDEFPIGRLCKAAAQRRDHLEYRLAVTADSADGLTASLRDWLSEQQEHEACGTRPRVVFVFPGQGSQWEGMGRELMDAVPEFHETMLRCDAVIQRYADGWSLVSALRGDDMAWLEQTARVQPALWAMGVSLAALWRSWGIEPDAVLGQSQGEIAAACCAGALSLEQAGRLSCLRAGLLDELAPPGAMCWVEQPSSGIADLLADLGAVASIAVAESPLTTVLSGPPDQIEKIVAGCESQGISCQRVQVGYAAHSPLVDAVRQPLLEGLDGLVPGPAEVPFLSTVTGTALPGTALDRDYWWRNLRETVRLEETVRAQTGPVPVAFVQMAPHPVLTVALQESVVTAGAEAHVLESLRRGKPELACLYGTLAALYTLGCDPDWRTVQGPGDFMELPSYPWQRSSIWHQPEDCPWPPISTETRPDGALEPVRVPEAEDLPVPEAAAHPLLGTVGTLPEPWSGRLDGPGADFLVGHQLGDDTVMPGTGYLELMLAAGQQLFPGRRPEVRDAEFSEMLLLTDDFTEIELQVTARKEGDGRRVDVSARPGPDGAWTLHATALLADSARAGRAPEDLEAVRRRCAGRQDGEEFYRRHAAAGNRWEGAFRGIAHLWLGDGEALARVRAAPDADDGFCFHPAALDACVQVLAAMADQEGQRLVLRGVDRLTVRTPAVPARLWSHVRIVSREAEELCADVMVLDNAGSVVAEFTGVRGRILGGREQRAPARAERYAPVWRPAMTGAKMSGGHWLLWGGGTALKARLSRSLTSAGCTVSRARGDTDTGAGLARTLRTASRKAPVDGLLYLRALADDVEEDASASQVQEKATELCVLLALLTDAVGRLDQPTLPRVVVLTRGAQAVTSEESVLAPWQAALWGIGPVIGQERRGVAVTLVDLDPDDGGTIVTRRLLDVLLAPGQEDRVALRDGRSLALRLTAVRADEGDLSAPPIRPDVTYLVTGGLGGIGGLFAQWLVDHGARHLLLIGRSAVTADPASSDPRAILLDALRAQGAEVQYEAADVTDHNALAALLASRRRDGQPPPAGVVHSAAVLEPCGVRDMSAADIDATLRPKVAGGWVLHRLFADQPLDFFVLFSSAVSFLSGLALSHQLGAYAAANAFTDALGAYRLSLSLPATVVNWGYWTETGLAARLSAASGHDVRPQGLLPIHPRQAPGLFAEVLAAHGQVVQLPADWDAYAEAYPEDAHKPLLRDVLGTKPVPSKPGAAVSAPRPSAPPVTAPARPETKSAPTTPLRSAQREDVSDVEEQLVACLAHVLSVEPTRIDRGRSLNRMGMDSLMATSVRARLRAEHGHEVTVPQLLSTDSVRTLARRLADRRSAPRSRS